MGEGGSIPSTARADVSSSASKVESFKTLFVLGPLELPAVKAAFKLSCRLWKARDAHTRSHGKSHCLTGRSESFPELVC